MPGIEPKDLKRRIAVLEWDSTERCCVVKPEPDSDKAESFSRFSLFIVDKASLDKVKDHQLSDSAKALLPVKKPEEDTTMADVQDSKPSDAIALDPFPQQVLAINASQPPSLRDIKDDQWVTKRDHIRTAEEDVWLVYGDNLRFSQAGVKVGDDDARGIPVKRWKFLL